MVDMIRAEEAKKRIEKAMELDREQEDVKILAALAGAIQAKKAEFVLPVTSASRKYIESILKSYGYSTLYKSRSDVKVHSLYSGLWTMENSVLHNNDEATGVLVVRF